jgi:phosphocarrier protein HPr
MISRKIMITNPSGLHLRPAGVLSTLAMKYKSDIRILYGEKNVVVKSVLNVMAAGIKTGSEVTLTCDGVDEKEAMDGISKAIEDGLGEK